MCSCSELYVAMSGAISHVLGRVYTGGLLHRWCFHTIRSQESDSVAESLVALCLLFSCDVVPALWISIWSHHHVCFHSSLLLLADVRQIVQTGQRHGWRVIGKKEENRFGSLVGHGALEPKSRFPSKALAS